MAEPATASARRFLTFRLDRRFYALPAEEVAEIIRPPRVARVPQAPKALIGLANLRGVVLPVASLRGLLGLEEAEAGETARAIVLRGEQPLALAVDAVEALVTIPDERVETDALAVLPGEKITGAFAVDGAGVAKILDLHALLDQTFIPRRTSKPQSTATALSLRREEDTRAVDAETLVTFDVAGQEYALPLATVREVVSSPDSSAAMPHAESVVLGVMAYRDRLLPLLSLRGLLGFAPTSEADGRERVVVASVAGALVGLVADRARAIVAAEHDRTDPIPSVLAARAGGEARIAAIYRGEEGRRLISILAPEQLFREDVMQRLGVKESDVQTHAPIPRAAELQFLVFRLGADEFGLPIESVDEVAQVPDQITRVPKTPKFLEGVVNLRGEVLAVVDQRRRFDMPPLEGSAVRRLIVVRTERHRAGLIVDSVSEVRRVGRDAVAPPPELTGDITRLVQGVINLESEGRIVLLLDPAELLTRAERGLLDAFERRTKT